MPDEPLLVALLYGGYSGEAHVSEKSARAVHASIRERFDVVPIRVEEDAWRVTPFSASPKSRSLDFGRFAVLEGATCRPIDVAFLATHGTPGEDGKVQGFLDLLGVPYTSVGATESAVTFNKRYTVAIASYYGIKTARHVAVPGREAESAALRCEGLSFPVFVKPASSGSSIGISMVSSREEIAAAVRRAALECDEVLVEERIVGPVYTIGVYAEDGRRTMLPPLRCDLLDDRKQFFDYETKTTQDDYSRLVRVPDKSPEYEILERFALRVFEVFGARGTMRIDAVLPESGECHLLEVNTIPGMATTSAFPRMIVETGMSLTEFYSRQILEAVRERPRRVGGRTERA